MPPRLWATELGIGVNLARLDQRPSELWQGRLVALRVVVRGVVVDARAQFTTVLGAAVAPLRVSAELRVGFSGHRWAVVAGAYLLDGLQTQPRFLSILPTARAELSLGPVSVVAGLWDFHLPDVPVRLSLEAGDVGVGVVYPLGLEAHVRWRAAPFIGLTGQVLVLQKPSGEVVALGGVMVTLGVLSGKPYGRRTLLPSILDPAR